MLDLNMTTFARSVRSSRAVLLAGVVGSLALAGCSGDPAATPASTTDAGRVAPTAVPTTTGPTATPVAKPTTTAPAVTKNFPVNKVLSDTPLGQKVTVKQVTRNVLWPAGPVSKNQFEIVAVQFEWTASARYSSSIDPTMFTVKSTGPFAAPATDDYKSYWAKGGRPTILTAAPGTTTKGWLFFRINPKNVHPLTLVWTRPATTITTTNKKVAAAKYTVKLP